MPLLEVEGLEVAFPTGAGLLRPVRDVSFSVNEGETLCVVGESGCGKSLTSLALMDLLPSKARRTARRLAFAGENLIGRTQKEMAGIRGSRMAMIFQEPMTSLNPAYTIGNQLEEAYLLHNKASRSEARDRAVMFIEKVGITGGAHRLKSYPHQLSGGQRQRIMIAMAIICGPELLIADEPTTALDVTIQAQILGLLMSLQRELKMGMILITHDLGVVANVADRVAVMYAGEVVELATTNQMLSAPRHPYTEGLIACLPVPGKTERGGRLGSIPGMVPSLLNPPVGCIFANRCPYAEPVCRVKDVALREAEGVLYRCLFTPAERRAKATGRVPA